MINIDDNINSYIEESANSYLNDLGHVFKGIVDRFNSFRIIGEHLDKNIEFNSKDNNLSDYIYTETVRFENKEIELKMVVKDRFASVNFFETIKNEKEDYNELTVDIFKAKNKITMYSLTNHRTNNSNLRISFNDVKLLPEISDSYDIDLQTFKTKEGSLLDGIDLYHRTRGYKKIKK